MVPKIRCIDKSIIGNLRLSTLSRAFRSVSFQQHDGWAIWPRAVDNRRQSFPKYGIKPHCRKSGKRPCTSLDSERAPPLIQKRLVSDSHVMSCCLGKIHENESGYVTQLVARVCKNVSDRERKVASSETYSAARSWQSAWPSGMRQSLSPPWHK